MSLYRISNRFPKPALTHRLLKSLLFSNPPQNHSHLITFNQFHSLLNLPNKVVTARVSPLNHLGHYSSVLQHFRFSSSTASENDEKEKPNLEKGADDTENKEATAETSADGKLAEQKEDTSSESSEDTEEELTMEDLIKLLTEKEELLKAKHKEIESMKEKVLRTYAEMENVMDRTKREAENSKKFAIQSFAKGLLDVADNLDRAASVVEDSFSKIDTSEDSAGAARLLRTLLEGLEMTGKQLMEVFKKFGVEKYDPMGEQFDPNRHNAVFQVPDASKPPDTVQVVLKSGYVLHDRVIRPAEVGVTKAVQNNGTDQGSKE